VRLLNAQLNYTVGDLQGNTRKILQTLEEAKKKQVDIVVFSEMAISGYPPEDLLLHDSFLEEMEASLKKIEEASVGLFVVVGTVRRNEDKAGNPLCNSAAILENGRLVGYHDKWLLPTYDVFDERRYFNPGSEVVLWHYKGKKIAVLVCEDIWQHAKWPGLAIYERDPVEALKLQAPDLVIAISASPYHLQKLSLRVQIAKAVAVSLQSKVVFCCQVGGNDQLVFDGYSFFMKEDGSLLDVAKGFEEEMKIWELSQSQAAFFHFAEPMQELFAALVLGLKDYFYKSGFSKGCLGLSGGIDSALVACIAVEALGKENVLTLAMPSRYSSASSIHDAKKLAEQLGVQCEEISIEGPFQSYLDLLGPFFKGLAFDVTEENLQARVRGMILMALSNKLGYIVLSTGNKSEMAVGYSTLYGDLCGGVSVISDLTKTQVYELSNYLHKERGLIPLSILEKEPSAELRPHQKDSDSLPSYAVLDKVLQGYVEECKSAEEIAHLAGVDLAVVKDLIGKIHKAEYKRRQAPPGFRVSKKSFHIGRRYPIVQKWR
jgi:NAD+ synthase (glutamine-hydrolysing)